MITELSKKNAKVLGKDTNLLQTIEECSELIKAICKYNRTLGVGQKTEVSTETAYGNLIREIADVVICLEQLIYLHDIQHEVKEAKADALIKVAKRYGLSVYGYEEEEDTCFYCKYDDKDCNQMPCVICKNRYTNQFKTKD